VPLVQNPRERGLERDTSGPKLWLGGAGGHVPDGFVNLDIVPASNVDVRADITWLPFADDTFGAIECDAVLEHVRDPETAVRELHRVLKPGGELHVVVPFCHPFHAYPHDYSRWTIPGLRQLLGRFDIVDAGVRTGPTATMLTFFLEYVKLLVPPALSTAAYGLVGWVVWPLRGLDRWLLRSSRAHVLANSIYVLVQKAKPGDARLDRDPAQRQVSSAR
jgi:SAM-dependent methyltransferase